MLKAAIAAARLRHPNSMPNPTDCCAWIEDGGYFPFGNGSGLQFVASIGLSSLQETNDYESWGKMVAHELKDMGVRLDDVMGCKPVIRFNSTEDVAACKLIYCPNERADSTPTDAGASNRGRR